MKIFVITPVRNVEDSVKSYIDDVVYFLGSLGHRVYYPPVDTEQVDPTGGFRICAQNKNGIFNADVVLVFWDGKSSGSLFDAGVAFALNKPIIAMLIPHMIAGGKSFQNMFAYWDSLSGDHPDHQALVSDLNRLDIPLRSWYN